MATIRYTVDKDYTDVGSLEARFYDSATNTLVTDPYTTSAGIQLAGGEFYSYYVGSHLYYLVKQDAFFELYPSFAALSIDYSDSTATISLTGGVLGDILITGSGNDVLNGAGGNDTMAGGLGDDTYRVYDAGDTVVEAVGEGLADRVISAVTYQLTGDAEVEFLSTNSSTATKNINLTGNKFAQEITGNYGNNVLRDGPAGGAADELRGLNGNDTYQIYNSATTIVESASASGGTADRVAAGVDYVLASNIGIEFMQTNGSIGTAGIDLTGNALKQTIIGNAGANVLSTGGGAADTMQGLNGNDSYRVYNAADVVIEAAGSAAGTADRVIAAVDYALAQGVYVEIMQTNGATGKSGIDLTGNESTQAITGNAGSNILDGKDGNDTLTGLGGKDFFVFSSWVSPTNVDTITDFNAADDTIRLESAMFDAIIGKGVLSASQFVASAAGTAQDLDDRILYQTGTGKLFYDINGSAVGGSVHFATLTGAPAVTNADFVVI